ncbi:MAG TPA: 6-phosphogluconolactonase [Phycisphaerae bacterium]|nr:6-phosphogluconolactonase [Phycisphaerae bacterium]
MATSELIICKDPEGLAAGAADLVIRAGREAINQRGRFMLGLSGGSTPEQTYKLLTQPDHAAAIEWARSHLFFGDERFVPLDDARSNFCMVKRTLLSRPALSQAHVFPMVTPGKNVRQCAAEYARVLEREFAAGANNGPPRFDLILLGLGEDGHTASLFPGAMALLVEHEWVTWSPPGTAPPPVNRITLTYPVLNTARRIAFLVAGKKKASILRKVLEAKPARDACPAAGVHPADGTVTWLVDEDAAGLLTRRS